MAWNGPKIMPWKGTFFQAISYGMTLGPWIKKLHKWNPEVVYYVFAYDYGLRSIKSIEITDA